MSVFRVSLNNGVQGLLDLDPSTATPVDAGEGLGTPISPSLQRTIYVTGPGHIARKLKDGDQFTDCNYWKRFAYPQVDYDQAFIEVVTDDGSIYSDVPSENTFLRVYDITVSYGDDYSDAVADILGDNGGPATMCQITNQGSSHVKCKVNGSATAIFDLDGGDVQTFDSGDLAITKLEFLNTVSGGDDTTIQIVATIRSQINS